MFWAVEGSWGGLKFVAAAGRRPTLKKGTVGAIAEAQSSEQQTTDLRQLDRLCHRGCAMPFCAEGT